MAFGCGGSFANRGERRARQSVSRPSIIQPKIARVISRRRFLKRTIGGALLLGGAYVVGRQIGRYSVEEAVARRLEVLSPKEYLVLAAVARRICASDGGTPAMPTSDDTGVALFVDGYLARLEPHLRSDVKALLQLVEHGGFFRLRALRFTRMSSEEQDAMLADWETSRLAVRRQGFQALKTMCLLGYWRDDRTWAALGYTGPMVKRARKT
jgi:hypothetical protein